MITEEEVINNSIEYKNHRIFCSKDATNHFMYVLTKENTVVFITDSDSIEVAKRAIDFNNLYARNTIYTWFLNYQKEEIVPIDELLILQVQ